MSEEIKIVTPDGRRGLWLETDSEKSPTYVKLRAGREGSDAELELHHGQPVIAKNLHDLVDVVTTLRYAFETAEDDHARWAEERDAARAKVVAFGAIALTVGAGASDDTHDVVVRVAEAKAEREAALARADATEKRLEELVKAFDTAYPIGKPSRKGAEWKADYAALQAALKAARSKP